MQSTERRDNERVAESPRITTELLLSRRLSATDEQDVVAFFGRFGAISRHRRVRAHRGAAIDWLVLAALPLQAFLQNLGTLTGGDAYVAFKSFIARLSHHEPHPHQEATKVRPIILQDANSGLRVMIEFGLPEIAYTQLHQLNLAQFSSGPIHFDRNLGCWRADDDEAATLTSRAHRGAKVWSWLAARRAKRDTSAGRRCLANGDLEGASAYFHKATLTAPGKWEPRYWAGCVAAHCGDYATAYNHFTIALEIDSNIGQIFTQRGYGSIRRGDMKGALHDLRAAARLSALDDLGQLALGALELRAGRGEHARQALRAVSRADLAGYREALLGLAAEHEGDAGSALAAYSAAIGHGNATDPVLFRHAMAALRAGTGRAGHASWMVLRDRHPKRQVFARGAAVCDVLLAGERLRAGDADNAARTLLAAARDLDRAPWLANNLAVAEYLNGEVARAAWLWEHVLRVRPGDVRVRTAAAICQARLGAPDTACQEFAALAGAELGWPRIPAVRVTPAPAGERPAWREIAARVRLAALTAAKNGDWARAGALTGVTRSLLPGVEGTDLLDALMLLRSGNRNSAIELLAESSRKRPADTQLLHMRAVVLLHTLRGLVGQTAPEPLWRQCVSAWAALLADEDFWSAWQTRAEQRYQATIDALALTKARDSVRSMMEKSLPNDAARLLFRRELAAARALRRLGGFPVPGRPGESVTAGPLRIAELGLHEEFGVFAAAADRSGASRQPPSATLLRTFSALGVAHCLLLDGRAAEALAATADLRCADCRTRPKTTEPMVCAPGCARFAAENPAAAGLPGGRARLAAEGRSLLLEALQEAARAGLAAAELEITTAVGYWRRALALTGPDLRASVERTIGDQALGRARTLREADKNDAAIDLLGQARELVGTLAGGRIGGQLAVLLNNRGAGRLRTDPASALADLRRATALNPHDRLLWMNRVAGEEDVLATGLSKRDQAAIGQRLKTLEPVISEALRYLPDDPELTSRWKSIMAMRANIELEAFGAALNGRDPAAVRRRLLATAEVADTALARFPGDPEFIKLRQVLTPWLEKLTRRA